jgi:hypothetical protein
MNTSPFEKRTSVWPRAYIVASLLASVGLAACGFTGGFSDDNIPEGDRCNPLSPHNDCASGLICTLASGPNGQVFSGQSSLSGPVIPFCPENYCCSIDSMGNINSSNPICQPGCSGGAASICTANSGSPACTCAGVLEDGGMTTDPACQPPPMMDAATPSEGGTEAGPDTGPEAAPAGEGGSSDAGDAGAG